MSAVNAMGFEVRLKGLTLITDNGSLSFAILPAYRTISDFAVGYSSSRA